MRHKGQIIMYSLYIYANFTIIFALRYPTNAAIMCIKSAAADLRLCPIV